MKQEEMSSEEEKPPSNGWIAEFFKSEGEEIQKELALL